MLKSVRVAFVAGLLAAAAFPVTFHTDALAQGSGGSGGGSGTSDSGTGTAGTGGTGTGGTGSAGTSAPGAAPSSVGTTTPGASAVGGTRAGEGGAGTQRTLPGSTATTGTPVNRNAAPGAQRARPGAMERVNSQDYLNSVGSSDMFEVASSQVALERSSNQRVQDFARKMVGDHTQSSQKVTQALSSSGSNMRVPSQMSTEHQRMLERLRAAKRGAEFDRMYLDMQVRGHERALAFHRSYANTGDNPALQGVARELVPAVQQHLNEVRQLAGDRGTRRQGARERRGGAGS